MKRLTAILSIFVLILVGCNDGSVGPRGPEGPPGEPGPVGQGFEVVANFNAGNEYVPEPFVFANYGAEALESDIVVVYWLFEEGTVDVWQQLPATVYFDDGQFQYAFDHTLDDVQLFLQGNIDFSTLGSGYTQDQIFRIAILPVDDVQSNNIILENMEEVRGAVKNSGNLERIVLD